MNKNQKDTSIKQFDALGILFYPACIIITFAFSILKGILNILYSLCKILSKWYQVPLHKRKKLVIIGGGFTGSICAQNLQNKFNVTLCDTKEYFEFTPSILKTLASPAHIRNIQMLHHHYLDQTNLLNSKAIELKQDTLLVEHNHTKISQIIDFDYLIIASGASYNTPFPLVKEGPTCWRGNFLREDHFRMNKADVVLIIGGGAVGVELAAEIVCQWPGTKKVILIQSQTTLLSRLPKKARDYAQNFLVNGGVEILFEERVVSCEENDGEYFYITDKGREIKAQLVYTCPGIRPNSEFLNKNFPRVMTDLGYICTNEKLQMMNSNTTFQNIFVGGDVADFKEEKLAQTAEIEANVITNNILAVEFEKKFKSYYPSDKPILVSLGPFKCIFVYKNWTWCGFFPSLMKVVVENKTMLAKYA